MATVEVAAVISAFGGALPKGTGGGVAALEALALSDLAIAEEAFALAAACRATRFSSALAIASAASSGVVLHIISAER